MSELKDVLKAINSLHDQCAAMETKINNITLPEQKADSLIQKDISTLRTDFQKEISSVRADLTSLRNEVQKSQTVTEVQATVETTQAQPQTQTQTVHVIHEDYIPCRIWQFRDDYNTRMRVLEEQYHIDLEDATKNKKDVERDYKNEKDKIQKYFDKIILKEDETDPDYINPLRITNYQGRFVQLVQDIDGLVHKNEDGTFNVILAKGPNTLVIGVCDGLDGDILKVYDSGFHYVTTAGLEEIRAGGFICPAKNKRGKVNYIQNASGSIDDIDKFRIPIGKIVGIDGSSENPSSVFCKLCD